MSTRSIAVGTITLSYSINMVGYLLLSAYLLVVQLATVAGREYCYIGAYYTTWCDDDKYCCNDNTSCCSAISTGAIIGIVIGSLACCGICIGVLIYMCAKSSNRQGTVVHSYPHGTTAGVVTVATIQNPNLGQHYGPQPPSYGQQQFAPPQYQQGGPGPSWSAPNQVPQHAAFPPK